MANQDSIVIAFVTDYKFLDFTMITLLSIIKNTNMPIRAYILSQDISTNDKEKRLEKFKGFNLELIFIDYDADKFKNYRIANKYISLTTYAKFYIPALIPEERVIYVDSDVAVVRDIKTLWDLFDEKYSIMAVANPSYLKWKDLDLLGMENGQKTFNAGILYLNLTKIRKDNSSENLFVFSNQYHNLVKLHDESAFNYVYMKDWKELPAYYNYTTLFFRRSKKIRGISPSENQNNLKNLTILHYSGIDKPWQYVSPHPYNSIWRKYYHEYSGNNAYDSITIGKIIKKILKKAKYVFSYNKKI